MPILNLGKLFAFSILNLIRLQKEWCGSPRRINLQTHTFKAISLDCNRTMLMDFISINLETLLMGV
jgi:hypothetical protein